MNIIKSGVRICEGSDKKRFSLSSVYCNIIDNVHM